MSFRQRTIAVIVENHYIATPDGVFARQGMGHPYGYWQQFLEFFDQVCPVARVGWAAAADPAWKRADGPGVEFISIRDHAGPRQLARMLPHTLVRIRRGLRRADCVLIRGGGSMSTLSWLCCRALGVPYGRQVVGRDGEALHVAFTQVPHPVRRLLSGTADWLARRQIAGAVCAAYVSPALQKLYPAAADAPVFYFSDVSLSAAVITGPRPVETFCAAPLRLVCVGRLSREKGHHVLLEALQHLDRAGRRGWTLELIGPGPQTESLRAVAMRLGVADRVAMPGLVPWGPKLFARLDAADLFVLPSLTEGLPRAVLEAMSRGVPAVGTSVGGVPDIIHPDDLVVPGDARALAAAMARYLGRRELLAAASQRDFATATAWRAEIMAATKRAFFAALRERTIDMRGR